MLVRTHPIEECWSKGAVFNCYHYTYWVKSITLKLSYCVILLQHIWMASTALYISDAQPFILRMVWTLPTPPPTTRTFQRPLIPIPLFVVQSECALPSKIYFCCHCFLFDLPDLPPVWSSRNNNSAAGGEILKTNQHFFSRSVWSVDKSLFTVSTSTTYLR